MMGEWVPFAIMAMNISLNTALNNVEQQLREQEKQIRLIEQDSYCITRTLSAVNWYYGPMAQLFCLSHTDFCSNDDDGVKGALAEVIIKDIEKCKNEP